MGVADRVVLPPGEAGERVGRRVRAGRVGAGSDSFVGPLLAAGHLQPQSNHVGENGGGRLLNLGPASVGAERGEDFERLGQATDRLGPDQLGHRRGDGGREFRVYGGGDRGAPSRKRGGLDAVRQRHEVSRPAMRGDSNDIPRLARSWLGRTAARRPVSMSPSAAVTEPERNHPSSSHEVDALTWWHRLTLRRTVVV